MTLINLNNKIVKCRSCNCLVNFREKIAKDKRRQYIDQTYWGEPIIIPSSTKDDDLDRYKNFLEEKINDCMKLAEKNLNA